ncbi:MAG: hypothetical protein ACOY3X_09190 [Pseudomonadota bacterium]
MIRMLIAVLAMSFSFSVFAEGEGKSPEAKTPESVSLKDLAAAPCTPGEIYDTRADGTRLTPSGQGALLRFPGKQGQFADVTETERKSRIAEDLAKLLKYLADRTSTMDAATDAKPHCFEFNQAYQRSTIDIVFKDAGKQEINRRTGLIAGPEEHWYITADAPVTNPKQLKFDAGEGKVVEKEVPSVFYLGINYQIGDLYRNYDVEWTSWKGWFSRKEGPENWRNFGNRLSLKAMLKADKDPSESWGLGLGYTTHYVDFFVANVWTQQEVATAGKELHHTDNVVYGVSFNVSRGIEWLSGAVK